MERQVIGAYHHCGSGFQYPQEATLDFAIGELRDASGEIVVPQQSIVELGEQDREFIDAVRENRDPAITGEAILPTMRILQEAQDSRSRNE